MLKFGTQPKRSLTAKPKSTKQAPKKEPKPKPAWDSTQSDLDRYKLSQAEIVQKKVSKISKHRYAAKELWEKRQEKLKNGIVDEETQAVFETAMSTKRPPEKNNKNNTYFIRNDLTGESQQFSQYENSIERQNGGEFQNESDNEENLSMSDLNMAEGKRHLQKTVSASNVRRPSTSHADLKGTATTVTTYSSANTNKFMKKTSQGSGRPTTTSSTASKNKKKNEFLEKIEDNLRDTRLFMEKINRYSSVKKGDNMEKALEIFNSIEKEKQQKINVKGATITQTTSGNQIHEIKDGFLTTGTRTLEDNQGFDDLLLSDGTSNNNPVKKQLDLNVEVQNKNDDITSYFTSLNNIENTIKFLENNIMASEKEVATTGGTTTNAIGTARSQNTNKESTTVRTSTRDPVTETNSTAIQEHFANEASQSMIREVKDTERKDSPHARELVDALFDQSPKNGGVVSRFKSSDIGHLDANKFHMDELKSASPSAKKYDNCLQESKIDEKFKATTQNSLDDEQISFTLTMRSTDHFEEGERSKMGATQGLSRVGSVEKTINIEDHEMMGSEEEKPRQFNAMAHQPHPFTTADHHQYPSPRAPTQQYSHAPAPQQYIPAAPQQQHPQPQQFPQQIYSSQQQRQPLQAQPIPTSYQSEYERQNTIPQPTTLDNMISPNYDDGLYDEDDAEIERMKHMLKNTLADIEKMEIKKPSIFHDLDSADSKENINGNLPSSQHQPQTSLKIVQNAADSKKNISNSVNDQLNVIFDAQKQVLDEITDKVHTKLEQTNKFDQSTINPASSYNNDYFHQNLTTAGKDLTMNNAAATTSHNYNTFGNSFALKSEFTTFGGNSSGKKENNNKFSQHQQQQPVSFGNSRDLPSNGNGNSFIQNDLSIKKPFTSGPTHQIYVPKFSNDNSLSIRSFIKK